MAADGGALNAAREGAARLRLSSVSVGDRLHALSLSIPSARRVALLGRNGIGKTTVLRLAAGLLAAEEGEVRTVGPIGYVPQAYGASLLPWLTVEANVLLGIADEQRANALARALHVAPRLAHLLDRYPYRLSGGEQQLTTIARAVASAPALLLLDEPFSALDMAMRVTVRDALASACAATRTTAILVTHEFDDAFAFASHAIVLGGAPPQVVFDGTLCDQGRERLEGLVLGRREEVET